MEWETKIWGKTRCSIYADNFTEHRLEVEVGGVCSFHYHEQRLNRFEIKSGIIRIVWCFGWDVKHIDLYADNNFEMPSLIPHQFQVLESGVVIERYYPDRGGTVENSDIVRLTKGCMIDDIDHIRGTVGILKEDGTFWEVEE